MALTATISARDNTSYRLWWATDDLLREVQALTATVPPLVNDTAPREVQIITERIGFRVIATVYTSVAWVEAAVNETLLDCALDSSEPSMIRLPPHARALLGAKWTEWQAKRDPQLVEKMPAALKCLGVGQPVNSLKTWGDFKLLVATRNALTHSKAEFLPHGAPSDSWLGALRARLEGLFPDAVGVPAGAPFIWPRCLGLGCATWAADTSRGILAEWSLALRRAGDTAGAHVPPPP